MAGAQPASAQFVLRQSSAARAYAQFDTGELAPDTRLRRMRMVLSQSMQKRDALQALVAAQHDQHSPSYHHWVTAAEYAQRFGADRNQIDAVAAWLTASGMKDVELSRGGNFLSFNGSADTVERALQVKLHTFKVNGETHYANTAAPALPLALRGRVSTIQGLDDFVPRAPRHRMQRQLPQYLASAGGAQSLGPGDLATIYNTSSLYSAGIDGRRATIAVVGAAVPSLADYRAYRARFGLPGNDFVTVMVPNGSAPAASSGAVTEAALDLELAGAMAPRAKLIYVQDGDVVGAVSYAIDNNLAQVVSMSYTVCELPGPEDLAYEALALQGVAEGITWVNATGDSGAAGCDAAGSAAATSGLNVNLPASLPEVTAVGGSRFAAAAAGQYWSASNGINGATALGYVPETVWNAATEGLPVTAGGGGASKDFFKPGYQSSITDGVDAREIPDVAIDAGESTPPYLIVSGGETLYVGGTSAATPVFAGIAALVNDYLLAHGAITRGGLGNMNLELYKLAQSEAAVFHDITTGSNKVVCAQGSVDCASGLLGYDAAAGYDMATGLGSVDAYKLAQSWQSAELAPSTVAVSAANAGGAGAVSLTARVNAPLNPAPGVVVFSWTNAAYLNVPTEFARVPVGEDGVAATTFAGMPDGANQVTAVFQGTTGLLSSSSSAVTVNVTHAGPPNATVTLLSAQAQVPYGVYLPFAATVSGTSTAPSGSVSFAIGDVVMGTAPVVAGIAQTLSAVLPPAGTAALSAHYSGDSTYGAADSSPFIMTVVAAAAKPRTPTAAADFTLTVPASLTVSPGSSASIAMSIAPVNGFSAPVTFTCTGTVSGFGCVAPAALTPRGTTTVVASLTAQLTAFLPLVTALFFPRRRRLGPVLPAALLLAFTGLLSGCGYHVNKMGEPAQANEEGTYTLTITATSGTLVHTGIISVTVQ